MGGIGVMRIREFLPTDRESGPIGHAVTIEGHVGDRKAVGLVSARTRTQYHRFGRYGYTLRLIDRKSDRSGYFAIFYEEIGQHGPFDCSDFPSLDLFT